MPHEKGFGDSGGHTHQNYQHARHPATGLKLQDNDLVVIKDGKQWPRSSMFDVRLANGEAQNRDAIH